MRFYKIFAVGLLLISAPSVAVANAALCATVKAADYRIACECAAQTGGEVKIIKGKTTWKTTRKDSFNICFQSRAAREIAPLQGVDACNKGAASLRGPCLCSVKNGGTARLEAMNGRITWTQMNTASYSQCLMRYERGQPL